MAQGKRALAYVLATKMAECGSLDLKEHNGQVRFKRTRRLELPLRLPPLSLCLDVRLVLCADGSAGSSCRQPSPAGPRPAESRRSSQHPGPVGPLAAAPVR